MDILGELIDLCALQGSVDFRCQMAGDYSIDHPQSAPGEAIFHVVLAGSCIVSPFEMTPFTASAGDLVVFPRGAPHMLSSVDPDQKCNRWVTRNRGVFSADPPSPDAAAEVDLLCGQFKYDRAGAAFLFETLPKALHVRATADNEELLWMTRMIRVEAEARRPCALEVITSLTTVLFLLALRQHLDTPHLDQGMLALLSDKLLLPSLLAMFTQPAREWTIQSLATQANRSRAAFARRFSSVAGKGPAEVLLAVRCQLALKMLRTTNLSLNEIANEVGYRSEASFSKAFARQMGFRPSEARRK